MPLNSGHLVVELRTTFVVNTLASEGAAPIVLLTTWTQELPSR